MNENITFGARKLKRRGVIHGCFTRDGVFTVSSATMIRALKVSIKVISVSTIWAMKGKRKIYFTMYHRK